MTVARRVWDAFPFRDELDLLEARLTELDSAVYRHVLVEAPLTHQGTRKPLYYAENRDRFAPWKDKIIHVIADLGGLPDHWARDHAMREAIGGGLGELGAGDVFVLCDVDEIPHPDVLQDAPGHVLALRHHIAAVNLIYPGWWTGPVATLGRPTCTMQRLRDRCRSALGQVLRTPQGTPRIAGWHFSWLGGPQAMRAKVHAFADIEQIPFVDASAERIYAERIHPAEPGTHLLVTQIDGSWPVYMQQRRGPASWYWPGEATVPR